MAMGVNTGMSRLPGFTCSNGGCPGAPILNRASRLPSMFWNSAGLLRISSRVLLSLRNVRS
ncbi:hypothetical protein D3C81_2012310 [compost metagenome]